MSKIIMNGEIYYSNDTKDSIITFESKDNSTPNKYSNVETLNSRDSHKTLLEKISAVSSNVRYMWNILSNLTPEDIGALAQNGNAVTASKLQTARNISLKGSVLGNSSFDGSGDISITTVLNENIIKRAYSNNKTTVSFNILGYDRYFGIISTLGSKGNNGNPILL